jgi:hypothetical protein
MAYADYAFYTGTYLGTAIASADFSRLAQRAAEVIDELTFQRAAGVITDATDTDTIAQIKLANCALAEDIQTAEASGNTDGIASESVGTYSVTYKSNSRASMTREQVFRSTAKRYLGQTYLMYPGL